MRFNGSTVFHNRMISGRCAVKEVICVICAATHWWSAGWTISCQCDDACSNSAMIWWIKSVSQSLEFRWMCSQSDMWCICQWDPVDLLSYNHMISDGCAVNVVYGDACSSSAVIHCINWVSQSCDFRWICSPTVYDVCSDPTTSCRNRWITWRYRWTTFRTGQLT